MTAEIEHGFTYWECPHCEFSHVLRSTVTTAPQCQLCLEDSGHVVPMRARMAQTTDVPEGIDARKERPETNPGAEAG